MKNLSLRIYIYLNVQYELTHLGMEEWSISMVHVDIKLGD